MKGSKMCKERECQCGEGHGACTTEFQYAVKIVCGEVRECKEGHLHLPVAPGLYFTAINIHNPSKCKTANFRWKVAVAGIEPGAISPYQRIPALGPDRAIEIDCRQILNALTPPPPFVKGYAVLESDIELDVVAVYSGTQGANWPLNSFHTERVEARCVPICEDLVLPLHTGLADWQTISPTAGPVVTLTGSLHSAWGKPPFGSAWVSQAQSDSLDATTVLRRYRLCWDLCFGYSVPRTFPIQALADNSATVYLNNQKVAVVSGFSAPTTHQVDSRFLQAGRNCLQVDVTNQGGPTGFALAGILHAVRGKCPCSPLPISTKPRERAVGDPIEGDESSAAEPEATETKKKKRNT